MTDAEGRRPIRSSPAGSPAGSARRLGEAAEPGPAGRAGCAKAPIRQLSFGGGITHQLTGDFHKFAVCRRLSQVRDRDRDATF